MLSVGSSKFAMRTHFDEVKIARLLSLAAHGPTHHSLITEAISHLPKPLQTRTPSLSSAEVHRASAILPSSFTPKRRRDTAVSDLCHTLPRPNRPTAPATACKHPNWRHPKSRSRNLQCRDAVHDRMLAAVHQVHIWEGEVF